MKERILYDDEFEKQLKAKANQFKMYPSDKVWNEVYSSLHTRRRRFVAGMTVLIGGILFLAGTQLIFPTRASRPKPISSEISATSKPFVAAGPHKFTNNAFTANALDNSDVQATPDISRNMISPFDGHTVFLPELPSGKSQYVSTEGVESSPEKMQNSPRIKPIQTADLLISNETAGKVVVLDLRDGRQTRQNYLVNYPDAELVAEKTVNSLSHIHNDRFGWELYVAPTLNTHYLNGLNYQTMNQSIQNAPIMVVRLANVNGFVDNTPVIGYELGGNLMYKVSKNISLKAGLAFSFNRYYIKAYNSSQPQASATLNSYLGYIADSTRNFAASGTDKNPTHYQNRYYQLSLPVGVEMKVVGDGKLQLHLGATIQPSYLLNTDAYVLSDDYNSYSKDALAFRRWNINLGAEAFVSYGTGKFRWELGPQVRYQLLSTYKNSYSLKENMLNYGIRIGISKTFR